MNRFQALCATTMKHSCPHSKEAEFPHGCTGMVRIPWLDTPELWAPSVCQAWSVRGTQKRVSPLVAGWGETEDC